MMEDPESSSIILVQRPCASQGALLPGCAFGLADGGKGPVGSAVKSVRAGADKNDGGSRVLLHHSCPLLPKI